MYGEVNLEHFDELIEGYGIASAYADRLDDLEREIAQVVTRLGDAHPTIDDFSNILESRMSFSDERIRHTAWLMQHVYSCRAWSVNQSIVLKKKHGTRGFESPLVDQIRKLEVPTRSVDLVEWQRAARRVHRGARKKLDVMMVDRRSRTIYAVVGQSFRQTKRLSPHLRLQVPYSSLFGNEDRLFVNANTDAANIATLRMVASLLKLAIPDYKVRCLMALTDDPGCSWRFQCHEVSRTPGESATKRRVPLDNFQLDSTHHDFKGLLEAEHNPLSSLPVGGGTRGYLKSAPVDRPIRSLMVLSSLLEEQETSVKHLVIKPAREIALNVAFTYGVSYPRDMYRHDLLELERARLVKRARNKDNAYGLTPKGIGRVFLMEKRFNHRAEGSPDILLDRVRRQGTLWAGANVL